MNYLFREFTMKINYKKDHGRFSGTPYRVCLYSTTKYGFYIDAHFEMDFTCWLISEPRSNHLIRKTMVDLVVHHIEFAYIWPPNMVVVLMRVS